ncbi:MAG: hypothetical protein ACP5FY_02040 [Kosmotogaceae bacterium]
MKRKIAVILISLLIVATASFGSYFNANNVGGSVIYFPLLFGIFSVNGYYRMGFEVFNSSQTGNLSFTPTMLYVGPTVSYSGALGQISGLEAGLDARILTGVENLSFNLFGRRFMLALGLRGQAMYSFFQPTEKFKTRLSPEISFIDVTRMTDRFKFSLFFWPIPVLIGFDMYF